MNHPRNRQPRAPRDHQRSAPRGSRDTNSSNVPTTQQVLPGTAVSIVLKADQPTGREVQGVVQDLLTRGNHPRGIKVRLRDGRIGRVQRMAGDVSHSAGSALTTPIPGSIHSSKPVHKPEDHLSEPPPRSLADFLPSEPNCRAELPSAQRERHTFSTANAVCPICGLFEGDELAVSHHVEEHLT